MQSRTASHRSRRRLLVLIVAQALALTGCVGIFGETIELHHDPLAAAQSGAGSVSLLKDVHDYRSDTSRIGRATITVFAITSGTVHASAPVPDELQKEILDALHGAGYEVNLVERLASPAAPTPVLQVDVTEFYFKNYNWLWPFVPTWGAVELLVQVHDPDGHPRLYQRLRAKGNSFCLTGHCAFDTATTKALTRVLNTLATDMGSEQFRTALDVGASPAVTAIPPAP
jgi:hypothetical protein